MNTEPSMRILAVNAGGSTLKLAMYTHRSGQLSCNAATQYSISEEDPVGRIQEFTEAHAQGQIDAVVHRIVHGGIALSAPCLINDQIERTIAMLRGLAPLHNPAALKWVHASQRALNEEVPQVAVFDTAFYRNLPQVAQSYAIPQRLSKQYPVRRYGFHGLAHHAMWRRWCELNPAACGKGRIISLQLGSGCSITAVQDGKSIDTSMGFSPLEGLVMSTRAGDIDPGLVLYLQEQENMGPKAMQRMLNQHSGLLGVSGISGDMRDLLGRSEPAAQFAIDLYCYRIRKYIGAYLAVLGGADAILFGGGVGQNAPTIRNKILESMQWSGIELKSEANEAARGTESRISTAQSAVAVWAINADEAAVMAQQAVDLIIGS